MRTEFRATAGFDLNALDLWLDPRSGGRLTLQEAVTTHEGRLLYAFLREADGGGMYPVIGGVPILVPDPYAWCGVHRDAMLATLAEFGLVDHTGIMMARLFASQGKWTLAPFTDDWVLREDYPHRPPSGTEASDLFSKFMEVAEKQPAQRALIEAVGEGGQLLEVGCGAGLLAGKLSCATHWAADLSLRAVLRAAGHGARPVVFDAESIPAVNDAFDTVVAANLIDLLDAPGDFLQEVMRVLKPGGRLVLTTPDPSLGQDEDEDDQIGAGLADAIAEAGLSIRTASDGLPWVRPHHERYFQVYFVRLVVAAKLE